MMQERSETDGRSNTGKTEASGPHNRDCVVFLSHSQSHTEGFQARMQKKEGRSWVNTMWKVNCDCNAQLQFFLSEKAKKGGMTKTFSNIWCKIEKW